MSTERFSLEEINNMSAETMRQVLREQELANLRADRQAAEAVAKQAEDEKFINDYFNEKFANQHPKFKDQF